MMAFRSLQKRFSILLLLPVGALLLVMGFAGFLYARNSLLKQWGEATILKLQRSAHHVDMRLSRPKQMMKMFHDFAGIPDARLVQNHIVSQLEQLEWVSDVDIRWTDPQQEAWVQQKMHHYMSQGMQYARQPEGEAEGFKEMPFHPGGGIRVTPPHFDSEAGSETVSLISDLKEENGEEIGRVEVKIPFRSLIETAEAAGWWQDHEAYLLDEEGNILASNLEVKRDRFGETGEAVEGSTLKAMKSLPFGTVFGEGFPPERVSGFYKLKEAPWTIVLIAPGSEILSPIVRFHVFYSLVGGIFILMVLILIRFVTGKTVSSIRKVSDAAFRISEGDYDVTLPVTTQDEVGELTESFNKMASQLEDRAHIKYCLNLASEVQKNLLPADGMQFDGLDIAGQSIYSEETGGDYYDFLELPEFGRNRIGIVVGDVSDHGVAAALLMTTARALIHGRITQTGGLAEIVTDVNRLLCSDTDRSGNFMTLFFSVIDLTRKELHWVRAGHDPAIFYDSARDKFEELGGSGMALGVDKGYRFKSYSRKGWGYGHILLIGTDGLWDTQNPAGEYYGKDRLRDLLRRYSHASAAGILKAVTDELKEFRGSGDQEDDVTLVVIKAKSEEL
ncbi:MAG: HAMP domain-containing protein [Desulfobacteraceae bacterium]|nr:MAG: HAMP domain-containing protein [Desulfobacteraceae bacterium]